ncbi:hypothetical protein T4E_1344, partial [Trichinella pseudospiralis]
LEHGLQGCHSISASKCWHGLSSHMCLNDNFIDCLEITCNFFGEFSHPVHTLPSTVSTRSKKQDLYFVCPICMVLLRMIDFPYYFLDI